KFGSFDLSARGSHQRKSDDEGGTQTFTRAFSADRSAVKLNQVTNDCQPEAEPAVLPGSRAIGLAEALKYMGQKITLDAFTGISHRDRYMSFVALQLDLDRAISRGEFHRI